MRITLVTVGSRGDVHPYIALGDGLHRAGHEVRLATHRTFAPLAERRGLAFTPVEGDPRALLETPAGQAWLRTGSNPLAFARAMRRLMRPLLTRATADCDDACRNADLVLFSVLGWLAAHHVTEKRDIPGVAAYLQPATPTRAFPSMLSPSHRSFGTLHNLATHLVGEQMFWHLFRPPMNAARREVLGLPKLPLRAPFGRARRAGLPTLYGYSPSVIPTPNDWPAHVHVTGYWFLERDPAWTPPDDLIRFLEAGPAPVYVGFGSMYDRGSARLTELVVEALHLAGQRAILLTGWGALTDRDLPDTVFPVESVPHDWLFPRVAAVVHHAGAGTTGQGLRAGVPTVAVPFFADQPFWAARVRRLGAGPRPIPVRRLSADRLARAVRSAVEDPEIRTRAAEIGRRIRSEDGPARAAAAIAAHFGS